MFALILSLLLLICCSHLISSHFAFSGRDYFWIIIAVTGLQLGLVTTITSLLYQLTMPGFLAAQVILTIAIFLLLRRLAPFSLKRLPAILKANLSRAKFFKFQSFTRALPPGTLILLLAIITFILLSGLVQYFVPLTQPNIYHDERSYNASRVIYWLQNQAVFPYPTHNDRQTVFTFGGELVFLWPLIFVKVELIGRMIFWLGYPLAIFALYLLLRALKTGRNLALAGALGFAATPMVIQQSNGLKPELWLTFFVLGVGYWLIRAQQQPEQARRCLFWAGLFLALSVNVKSTALALTPFVFILPWFTTSKDSRWQKVKALAGGVLLGVLLSGLGVVFGFNQASYGHILGPEAIRDVHTSDLSLRQLYTHAVRLPFLLLEFPILPSAAVRDNLTAAANAVISFLGAGIPLPLETQEWPGHYQYVAAEYATKFSLGGIVWLPLITVGGFRLLGNVRRTFPRVSLDALSILVLLDLALLSGIVFIIRWMVHSSLPERFLVAPYALGLAVSFTLLSKWAAHRRLLKGLAIILLAWLICPVFYRQSAQAVAAYFSPAWQVELDGPFAEPLNYIFDPAAILFVGDEFALDYHLFDPNHGYRHRVTPWGQASFNSSRMQQIIEAHRISHVLIQDNELIYFPGNLLLNPVEMSLWLAENPDFNQIPLSNRMLLFESNAAKKAREQHIEAGLQSLQAPPQAPLLIVDPVLQQQVGVQPDSLKTPAGPVWGPAVPAPGILWLEPGQNNRLEGQLWSKEPRLVHLSLDVLPAAIDQPHTVELTGLVNSRVMSVRETFTGPGSIGFAVPLKPGRNRFSILIPADSGSPAVGLKQIRVEPTP